MKLLADLGGEMLVSRTLRSLLDGGCDHVIVVTSAPEALASVPLVADPRVTIVVNSEPDRGMFSSVRCGLTTLPPGALAVVLPADMPFVRPETIRHVVASCRRTGRATAAAMDGRRGHPLALPASVVAALCGADPTGSLREALAAAGCAVAVEAVDDEGVLRDVDVPGDLGRTSS